MAAPGTNPPFSEILEARLVRDLVERACSSNALRRSARLRDFLSYVSEQALSGEAKKISETQIAVHVFGRNPDYDASSDNVVRVQARLLRQKLNEYFAGEGINEPIVIEIPKGAYVPVFLKRGDAFIEPGLHETVELSAQHPVGIRTSRALAALLVCALIAGLVGWRLHAWTSGSPDETRGPALTSGVVQKGRPTLVVVPDTALVVTSVLTEKSYPLDRYLSPEYRSSLATHPSVRKPNEFFGYLNSRRFTDLMAVNFYGRLVHQHPEAFPEIEIRHPRSIQLRDFQGKNVIFIGSPRGNPWVEAFHDKMNFRFTTAPDGNAEFISNAHPEGNEPAKFVPDPLKSGSGPGLATIALFANPFPPGNILVVSGSGGAATEGVSDLVTSPDGVAQLEKAIGKTSLQKARSFEFLLSIEIVGNAPRSWSVLAHRLQF